MQNGVRLVGWMLLLGCLGQAAAAEKAARVEAWGDPDRVTIEGAAAFTAKQIKDELFEDLDFRLAARRSAPLADYLKATESAIRAGYRHAGFADAAVTVELPSKADKIAVHVTEGPRYVRGDIRVAGNKTVPALQLVDRLTKPYLPRQTVAPTFVARQGKTVTCWVDREGENVQLADPVWNLGKPAHFLTAPEAETRLHVQVADALADLGYFFPRFTIDVTADAANRQAHLVIKIDKEGPRAVLGEPEITGNVRNTRAEILSYIAWKPGRVATRDEQSRIQRLLWRSGRFVKSEVTLSRPTALGAKTRLQIDLLELDGVPPLSQPLSPEEQALLKVRDWMANSKHWDGDLLVQTSGTSGSTTIVVSPTKGALADCRGTDPPTQRPAKYTVLCSLDEIGIYCLSDARKLTFHPNGGLLVCDFGMQLDPTEKGPEGQPRGKLTFGFGARSDRAESDPPFQLSLHLDPVAFVQLAHRSDHKSAVKGGVLTVSDSVMTLRAKANSGRLIDIVGTNVDESPVAKDSVGRPNGGDATASGAWSELRVSFSQGELDRHIRELRTSTAKYVNTLDASRPVTSLLAFAADDQRLWQSLGLTKDDDARHVVRQILDRHVLQPLDDPVYDFFVKTDDTNCANTFDVGEKIKDEAECTLGAYERMIAWGLAAVHLSYPRNSWPAVISQEAAFALAGAGEHVRKLAQIYDFSSSGPLCFLATGLTWERLDCTLARQTAARGLRGLSLQDFRKEYPIVFDPHSTVGQSARRIIAALRQLDDRDVRSLSTMLPDQAAAAFQHWAQKQREDPKKAVEQALAELLDAAWQAGLQAYVKATLENLQHRATEAIAIAPDGAETLRLHGADSHRNGKLDKALADYAAAIAADASNALAYCYRGFAYAEKSDREKARADFRQALHVDPLCWQAQDGLDGARIVGWAGTDMILTSELFDEIDEFLDRNTGKVPADQIERTRANFIRDAGAGIQEIVRSVGGVTWDGFLDMQRREAVRDLLGQAIGRKLIYQDLHHAITSEHLARVAYWGDKAFTQNRLKAIMDRENVKSAEELDARLRARGTSLEREKRVFVNWAVCDDCVRREVEADKPIPESEARAWYQAHGSEHDRPARARWEELRASFSSYPTHEEARAAAERCRKQALKGTSFAELAKTQPAGPAVIQTSKRDWTSKGSLVSEELDRNLFSLPLGQVSPIIEGPSAYHIIRVTEREEVRHIPFQEVQADIRRKMRAERIRQNSEKYRARILKDFPITTIIAFGLESKPAATQASSPSNEATAAGPKDTAHASASCQASYNEAKACEATGSLHIALLHCDAAIREGPNIPELHELRAKILNGLGRTAEASETLETAEKLRLPKTPAPVNTNQPPGWRSFSGFPDYSVTEEPKPVQ